MAALRMSQCEPTDKPRQFIVCARPDDHVPMIGHHTIREQSRLEPLDGIFQYAFEGGIVVIMFKDRLSRVRPIQHVKDQSASGSSFGSSHGDEQYRNGGEKSIKGS
jgi:hypothetical protein